MEAFFGYRGNSRAGSENKLFFLSFFDAKIDAMQVEFVYLPITKHFWSDLSKKNGKITYFLKQLQIESQNAVESVSRRQMH